MCLMDSYDAYNHVIRIALMFRRRLNSMMNFLDSI